MPIFTQALLNKYNIQVPNGVDITHVDFVECGEVVGTARDGKKLEKLARQHPLAIPQAVYPDALSSS